MYNTCLTDGACLPRQRWVPLCRTIDGGGRLGSRQVTVGEYRNMHSNMFSHDDPVKTNINVLWRFC